MKTIINKFALIAVAVVLTYCTPIEQDKDTLNSILEARKNLTQAESYFYEGDASKGENNVYDLRLMTEGVGVNYKLTSDEITENAYKETGYIVFFELNTTESAPAFPAGTFTADTEGTSESGTFSNAYCVVLNSGSTVANAEKLNLTEGSIIVTKAENSDDYTVAIAVTTIIGSKLELSYTGKIAVGDPVYLREPLTPSSLEFVLSDISFSSENIDSDGDGYYDISLAKLTLTGDKGLVVIDELPGELYPIGEEPRKPAAGTYTLTEWTYEDFTFTPGEIYENKLTGSYAWLSDGDGLFSDIWYLTDAVMTVTETGENYKISITGTSANGTAVTFVYEE